eukprot:1741632-Pleurochrysis_carterae.AAC.3
MLVATRNMRPPMLSMSGTRRKSCCNQSTAKFHLCDDRGAVYGGTTDTCTAINLDTMSCLLRIGRHCC